jgi:hypothetical protein
MSNDLVYDDEVETQHALTHHTAGVDWQRSVWGAGAVCFRSPEAIIRGWPHSSRKL